MGFWSSTFGGGNSFSQSVANVTTPNDGNTFVGGTATVDSSPRPVSRSDSSKPVAQSMTTPAAAASRALLRSPRLFQRVLR